MRCRKDAPNQWLEPFADVQGNAYIVPESSGTFRTVTFTQTVFEGYVSDGQFFVTGKYDFLVVVEVPVPDYGAGDRYLR